MPNLAGLHDIEGAALSPVETWLLDTISLSENQVPRHYDNDAPGRHIIARLNYGYGNTGTLPHPDDYDDFVLLVAHHVAATSGCHIWIIGNEPNLAREWPYKVPIMPYQYAACYRLCRAAIHALPGHEHDQVLIAAPGPWNDELKYAGNIIGDWIVYFKDVIAQVGDACDGFSFHTYTHGYDVSLVTSSARMNSPFPSRRYEFRTYLDYLEAIPASLSHLPCYITEANGNGPWQAVGLMPAMLNEIDNHNKGGGQQILSVIFFRYPDKDDGFEIKGKSGVEDEYRAAVAHGYSSPALAAAPATPVSQPIETQQSPAIGAGPSIEGEEPVPPVSIPDLVWDSRLTERGIKITPYVPKPGELYWKIVQGEYWLEKEHIFVDVLDQKGKKLAGVKLRRWWGDGKPNQEDFTETVNSSDRWMANFPMWNAGWSYWLQAQGYPSDMVEGMGLGSVEQPTWNIHLSYKFTYRLMQAGVAMPEPVTPPPAVMPPPKATPLPPVIIVPAPSGSVMVWPCKGTVSERWGGDPDYYQKELNIPYHNGTDIANALGTPLVSMAAGEVAIVGVDKNYGNYVRVWHEQLGLHTFLAHLLTVDVAAGQRVAQGQVLGKMGATGRLVTGPHVHVEVRLGEKASYVQGTFGHDNGRVDPETVVYVLNRLRAASVQTAVGVLGHDILSSLAVAAAQEFGLDVALFLRLVNAESSWQVDALSPAGAVGLTQLMTPTWDEWSAKVGATNILDAKDNLRVGAAYLAFLLAYYKGNYEKAVTAYNMGAGNVDAGVAASDATTAYVQEVVYNQAA